MLSLPLLWTPFAPKCTPRRAFSNQRLRKRQGVCFHAALTKYPLVHGGAVRAPGGGARGFLRGAAAALVEKGRVVDNLAALAVPLRGCSVPKRTNSPPPKGSVKPHFCRQGPLTSFYGEFKSLWAETLGSSRLRYMLSHDTIWHHGSSLIDSFNPQNLAI